MRPPRQRAFTLLELTLVIVLVGVLAVFVIPELSGVSRAEHLHDSAQRLRALVCMCRAEAMNQTRIYQMRIRPDGTVRVLTQADPLRAPHLYITPRVDWVQTELLHENVWIEAVQVMPGGPPPIRVINDKLEFPQTVIEPVPIAEYAAPLEFNFEPAGVSDSLRLVLRDITGEALLVTLDGRLGRVTIEAWPAIPPSEVERPAPWPEEPEVEYQPEDFA